MKYFNPDDLMLSMFFQMKKFENKGEMWELKYVALGLRKFTALLRYNKECRLATLKTERPIAIVKTRKQKIIKVRAAPEDNDVIVLPSDEENY